MRLCFATRPWAGRLICAESISPFCCAHEWNGGASFQGFLANIDKDAFANATDSERLAIEATGARAAYKAPALPRPHGPGRAWSKDEIFAIAGTGLKSGRNFKSGQLAFAAARCVVCHRFGGEGARRDPT